MYGWVFWIVSIWPYRKIAQGQSRVIIWTNLVLVLDAAYQLSRSLAFWCQRRRFFKVFTIYGHGGHTGHVTWTIWTNSRSPSQLHMQFGFNRSRRCLKMLTIYIHTDEKRPTYSIRSPMSLRLRWANYSNCLRISILSPFLFYNAFISIHLP